MSIDEQLLGLRELLAVAEDQATNHFMEERHGSLELWRRRIKVLREVIATVEGVEQMGNRDMLCASILIHGALDVACGDKRSGEIREAAITLFGKETVDRCVKANIERLEFDLRKLVEGRP